MICRQNSLLKPSFLHSPEICLRDFEMRDWVNFRPSFFSLVFSLPFHFSIFHAYRYEFRQLRFPKHFLARLRYVHVASSFKCHVLLKLRSHQKDVARNVVNKTPVSMIGQVATRHHQFGSIPVGALRSPARHLRTARVHRHARVHEALSTARRRSGSNGPPSRLHFLLIPLMIGK